MSCVGTSCPPQGQGARPLQPQEAAPFLPWYMGAEGQQVLCREPTRAGLPAPREPGRGGAGRGLFAGLHQSGSRAGKGAGTPGALPRSQGGWHVRWDPPTGQPRPRAPCPPASFSLVQERGSRGSLSASRGTEHFLRFLLSPAANWPHNTDKDKS